MQDQDLRMINAEALSESAAMALVPSKTRGTESRATFARFLVVSRAGAFCWNRLPVNPLQKRMPCPNTQAERGAKGKTMGHARDGEEASLT